ncbi:MAG: tRNA uridine-5-carboxymethylaminomethyl(34) synthesis GTPase MnmE, partial [Hominenteromicrobium sp.]
MKTIAAISTAAAPGGIGIIRISGEEARAVGDRVFRAVSGEKLRAAAGYTCRFGHVFDIDGTRLDECIATVFAAPKSFTGEDVVELSCHGGLFILKS